MEQVEELDSRIETVTRLLSLKKELNEIDEFYESKIHDHAKDAIHCLPNIEEEQKPDFLRRILLGKYETFNLLNIDMASFLKEVSELRQKSLDDAIVKAVYEEDITSHTVAQNIELFRQLSYMSGYMGQVTKKVFQDSRKMPLGDFFVSFYNYLRMKTEKEREKAYVIAKGLIENALSESPDIIIINIDNDPLLGYYTEIGLTDDYNDFLKKFQETTRQWVGIGMIRGRMNSKSNLNQEEVPKSFYVI